MKEFLEFNNKKNGFICNEGTYWISIKPICEDLNVNYNRQFQNIKNDKILNEAFAVQQIVDGDNKIRKNGLLTRILYLRLVVLNPFRQQRTR